MVLFLVTIAWIGFYIKNHWTDFAPAKTIVWPYILLLLAISLIYIIVQGLVLKVTLEPFKIRLKFFEWFGITVITFLGNYIFPFSGFGFRAAYLKKTYGFNYTSFIGSLVAIYLTEFFLFTLGGLIGLWSWYKATGFVDYKILTLFLAVFSICTVFLFFSPKLPVFQSKFLIHLNRVLHSFYFIKTDNNLMRKLLVIVLSEVILFSAIFFFAYRALHFPVSYLTSMIAAALSLYSLLIRITPASFGFYEAMVIYTTKLADLTVANGLLVAMVTRVVSMIWVFALWPLFGYFLLFGRRKHSFLQKPPK